MKKIRPNKIQTRDVPDYSCEIPAMVGKLAVAAAVIGNIEFLNSYSGLGVQDYALNGLHGMIQDVMHQLRDMGKGLYGDEPGLLFDEEVKG
jgi:hypothetical protein